MALTDYTDEILRSGFPAFAVWQHGRGARNWTVDLARIAEHDFPEQAH